MTTTHEMAPREKAGQKVAAKVAHIVTVRVDAEDPSDGFKYRGKIFTALTHEISLAWWLGNPVIIEIIHPCPCGDATVTVTSAE